MRSHGLECWFDDTYYDFRVGKNQTGNIEKVEVKSCQISIKSSYHKGDVRYSIGRFDFLKDNVEAQFEDNVWICLLLRWKEEYMVMGFIRARDCNKKRHISIHEAHSMDSMSLEYFISRLS